MRHITLKRACPRRPDSQGATQPGHRTPKRVTFMSTPGFDLALARRLDQPGPCYTVYPTADRFTGAFDARQYAQHVSRRHVGGQHRRLSLNIHVPFCRTRAAIYLDHLERELSLQSALCESGGLAVDQVHCSARSATFPSVPQMRRLMRSVRGSFRLADDHAGDFTIEVDPRFSDAPMVYALRAMGFNRISLWVRDFDPGAQRNGNLAHSAQQMAAVVDAARAEGFRSINIDLVHGLPSQTIMSFNQTLSRVIDLAPDRIALCTCAHPPRLSGPRGQNVEAELPRAETRLDIFQLSVRRLRDAGYRYIGMDQYALPGDDLAVAQDRGRLRLNLMGYTSHPDTDIVGVGASALSSVGASYSQNAADVITYCAALDAGGLPIARGIALGADDLLRRTVIHALICHGMLHLPSIEQAYLIDFGHYFAGELAELEAFESAGLVTIEPGNKPEWITVSPKGRNLMPCLCRLFDRSLTASGSLADSSAGGQ